MHVRLSSVDGHGVQLGSNFCSFERQERLIQATYTPLTGEALNIIHHEEPITLTAGSRCNSRSRPRAHSNHQPSRPNASLCTGAGNSERTGDIFSKGDELYDKRFGERYLLLDAARDSGGEFVRFEDTAAPGPSRRPISAHPAQRERFEVLSGTLDLTVDGEQHLLGLGESFVVQPGARHLPHNAGDGEVRFVAEMRPAGRFEEFLAEITAANNTGREGLAYLLTAARVINQFPDAEHPTPLPGALDRALFAVLATAGKLVGLRIPRTSGASPNPATE